MIIEEPIWSKWTDEKRKIDEGMRLRADAPDDVKKAFEEFLRKRKQNKKEGFEE
jgi:hypothetical protein